MSNIKAQLNKEFQLIKMTEQMAQLLIMDAQMLERIINIENRLADINERVKNLEKAKR